MACMKSPNLREMEGMISIDLVEAALAQRQFLGLVELMRTHVFTLVHMLKMLSGGTRLCFESNRS